MTKIDNVSDASPSHRQDNPIPPSDEYEDRCGIANSPTREHEQSSPHFSTLSITKHFLTSFFIPKKERLTTTDSVSPSETTPLLVTQTSSVGSHELQQRNTSWSIFWEEVKTLTKYALPVFGFVNDSPASQRTLSLNQIFQGRMCLSIVYSYPQWFLSATYPPLHSLPPQWGL